MLLFFWRQKKIFHTVCLCVLLTALGLTEASRSCAQGRPNILFIVIDDLRPELGCYGGENAVTPNIDRLAKQGVRFSHAYCNIAVCGASRASVFKGLRPTASRFTQYDTRADQDAPEVPSLPMIMQRHGYQTISNGKVYHKLGDDAEAWSEPAWHCKRSSRWWALPENRSPVEKYQRGPAYESADAPDAEYADHQICDKSLQDLRKFAKQRQPFFLACGFHRPHLPFVVPQKYWDLHPRKKVTLPANRDFPHDLPRVFRHNWGEMRSYRNIPKQGPVSAETAIDLIRGYRACVSFADTQVGRLLDELEKLDLARNTIIVLWSDHGWQLGEHGFWCKHTNFEVATHIPLIISAPGVKEGRVCSRLVESVDLYPTLCDLAGLPHPSHLQGKSLRPLLNDVQAKFKEAIFTRYGGGEAVRTESYRYLEMRAQRGLGKRTGMGLFNLEKDLAENQNIADDPAEARTRKQLESMLEEARGKALPLKIRLQRGP